MCSAGLLKQQEHHLLKENLGGKKGCLFVLAMSQSTVAASQSQSHI